MKTFDESLQEFIAAAPWLGPLDAPALATLEAIGAVLDAGDRTPALLAQWGLTYRSLLKRAPAEREDATDPLEAALAAAAA